MALIKSCYITVCGKKKFSKKTNLHSKRLRNYLLWKVYEYIYNAAIDVT
jgi:hypothetical protein